MASERPRAVPSHPPTPSPTHLEPVHQLQGLAVVLISFEDDIGQLVDDDVQGALLLRPHYWGGRAPLYTLGVQPSLGPHKGKGELVGAS